MEKATITYCEGKSRKAQQWVLRTAAWSDFCDRCAKPVRTRETMEQYVSFDRDRQGEIKDVGGFVCAILKDGKRKKQSVESRTAITYDLDFADDAERVWLMITQAMPGLALLVYSTHKHTPERPRLRIVVPLAALIPPDCYEPVARILAQKLGILDMLDCTTFETSRLFYWPSAAKDAEYFFRAKQGEPLRATDALGWYDKDWHCADNWPMSKHESREPQAAPAHGNGNSSQEDPLKKEGVIGAFCRAHYPIEDAIKELLSDVYKPCGAAFTYVGATTSAGLKCYEGKWAFSHHSTDPASGQDCNIFDLVRLHRFGHLDERSRQEGEKLPSFKAMLEFANDDGKTKVLLHKERLKEAGADFADLQDDEPEWIKTLKSKGGKTSPTIDNVRIVLTNDEKLKGLLRKNLFSDVIEKAKDTPWNNTGETWNDTDDACLRLYFEQAYGIEGKEKIFDGVTAVANESSYHPVKSYLDSLPEWDGEPRLDSLMIDYLGADDNDLNRMMTRLIFVAAVARIYRPGTKFDHCLILAGPEGIGKSTVLGVMGGQWHTDSVFTTDGKTGMEQIQGKWIIELGELDALKRNEVTQVKSFISSQTDTYRAAYARRPMPHPRQCVFFGTTNEESFLKGTDGNRKFWVMPLGGKTRKDFRQIAKERDQLWAEAKAKWEPGMPLCLDRQMERQARERAKAYNTDEEDLTNIESMLAQFLDISIPPDWERRGLQSRRMWLENGNDQDFDVVTYRRKEFCIAEFLYEYVKLSKSDDKYRFWALRVGKAMKRMPEWELIGPRKTMYGNQKMYRRRDVEL